MFKKVILLSMVFLLLAPTLAHSKDTYSNKKENWFFNPSKNHQPSTTDESYLSMLSEYGGFFIGPTDTKTVYLTFDNGYENGYTKSILDVLKKKNVPATFFVTGHYLMDQPELVQRMVKEGHIVGNHSWHHPDLTEVSDDRLREELSKVKEEFTRITGETEMHYLRPPRGVFSERTLALSHQEGYTNVFWSLAFVDWETNNQKGWEYAYNNIMKRIHPGAVLLLHTVSKDNAEALERVIDDLRQQGYSFQSLDQLSVRKMEPRIFFEGI
jgi:peptidoglycan-N-acetylmuramic acid deacetylase